MACLKCGAMSEDGALICGVCAEEAFRDPRIFLNPVLIGKSVFQRMRSEGSASALLGPTPGSQVVLMPSLDTQKQIADTSVEGMVAEDVRPFHEMCNTVLAHLGIPLKSEMKAIMLTDDAASTISTIVSKVEVAEESFPGQAMSDLYLRMGIVYWYSSHGILLRTASKEWADGKRNALQSRSAEYFSKVSSDDDLYSIAAYNLGMLGMDSGDWATAKENLARALEHFPNDGRIIESLAGANLELNNQMDAMALIDESLSVRENPQLWVLKGRVLKGMNMDEEALECFGRALSLDGRFMEAHDKTIAHLREMGRAEEASVAERQRSMAKTPDLDAKVEELINELKKASVEPIVRHERRLPPPPEEGPGEAEIESYPVELAKEALRSGNYDSAIQMADHILRDSPDSKDAQLVLIESLILTGDMSRASEFARSFYEKNRDDPKAWFWRGVVAEKEGKWGASVQYFSRAVTLDPTYTDSWVAMGEALLANKKVSGADESFSRALQVDGSSAPAWLGKAKAMRDLGRWGAAIQCLDKYNMLKPADRNPWLLKADILFEKGKHRRAIEAYDKYLELDQDDSYALGMKGMALNSLGMVEEARECLEEAVRLDPGNREAVKWLRSLSSGGEE